MISRQFTFDESEHIYTLKKSGVEVPGVSRVLDTGGFCLYEDIREDILERKAAIGREAHRTAVLYDRGRLDWESVDERVMGYARSWEWFCAATGFVADQTEHACVCEVYGRAFGMTLDRQGKTRSRIRRQGFDTTVEIKCTVSPAKRHELQTAGYAIGLPKNNIFSPFLRFSSRRRIVVYLMPTGRPHIHECESGEDYELYMSLLTIAEFKLRTAKIKRGEPWHEPRLLKRLSRSR